MSDFRLKPRRRSAPIGCPDRSRPSCTPGDAVTRWFRAFGTVLVAIGVHGCDSSKCLPGTTCVDPPVYSETPDASPATAPSDGGGSTDGPSADGTETSTDAGDSGLDGSLGAEGGSDANAGPDAAADAGSAVDAGPDAAGDAGSAVDAESAPDTGPDADTGPDVDGSSDAVADATTTEWRPRRGRIPFRSPPALRSPWSRLRARRARSCPMRPRLRSKGPSLS